MSAKQTLRKGLSLQVALALGLQRAKPALCLIQKAKPFVGCRAKPCKNLASKEFIQKRKYIYKKANLENKIYFLNSLF